MTISYITTCKGRLHHLQQTLPMALAAGAAECIVVDYGCPDGTGDWVRRHHPEVKVVTVADDPGFNCSRARNAGAAVARGPWLAFIDADVLLAPGFLARIAPSLRSGVFYVAESGDPNLWGSCLVEQAAFREVGGYDEAIDTWGGEDNALYEMLQWRGLSRQFYRGGLVTPIRHSNAERARYSSVKNLDRVTRMNGVYRAIKLDATRLASRALTLEERIQIRAVARDVVERAARGDTTPAQVAWFDRPIKTQPARPDDPPVLRCGLVVTLDRYGGEAPAAADPPAASDMATGEGAAVPGEP